MNPLWSNWKHRSNTLDIIMSATVSVAARCWRIVRWAWISPRSVYSGSAIKRNKHVLRAQWAYSRFLSCGKIMESKVASIRFWIVLSGGGTVWASGPPTFFNCVGLAHPLLALLSFVFCFAYHNWSSTFSRTGPPTFKSFRRRWSFSVRSSSSFALP